MDFVYNPPVVSSDNTRALTYGERVAFGMGAPMKVRVVLTDVGYRVALD
jgi:hypothetical protein